MVKINVCDICLKEGKLTKSVANVRVRNVIKIDLCARHRNTPPKDTIKFVQYAYGLQGIKITTEEARNMCRR